MAGLIEKARKFDPEGAGYDYETARRYGLKRNPEGRMPSRAPSGQLLKGRKHETWDKTVEGEKQMGYEIYKGKDGRYYSRKR